MLSYDFIVKVIIKQSENKMGNKSTGLGPVQICISDRKKAIRQTYNYQVPKDLWVYYVRNGKIGKEIQTTNMRMTLKVCWNVGTR
jgi:hypothetical protein